MWRAALLRGLARGARLAPRPTDAHYGGCDQRRGAALRPRKSAALQGELLQSKAAKQWPPKNPSAMPSCPAGLFVDNPGLYRRERGIRPGTGCSIRWSAPLVAVLFSIGINGAFADARAPLLMEGKKALYQRVLTRPGAQLTDQPGAAAGKPMPAFSQLYVYERRTVGGGEWLAVGAGSRGTIDGWMRADTTLPWKSQMALAFTNPAGRDRTLLFEQRDTVLDLLKAKDPAAAVKPIRDAVESGRGDARVVSEEPATYVDIAKQFYLLPILEAQEIDTGTGFRARVLEVASVTKRPAEPAPGTTPGAANVQASALRNFSAALVFVVDATISMGPYIERTRQAVRAIYDRVEHSGLAGRVKFGLIAFRSNVTAVPGLEYVAKLYVDPNQVTGGADFMKRVESLEPAKVSSAKFDEDPYAGLMLAVDGIQWENFGGRYVVLVTDAGAIAGSDPLSTTGLDAAQVRLELARRGIALYVLHLLTPEGKADHRIAERQYREAAFNQVVNKPLYYPLESGSVDRFGAVVDALGNAIVTQVEAASKGRLAAGSARAAQAEPNKATPGKAVASAIEADTSLLGLAMQLAYLGRVQGTAVPPVFRAWLADRDFANLDRPTTEVRVLLTKNQLSDLAQVVEAILKAGDESQRTSTADFFDLLRSAAANLVRDPAALRNPNATKLGELGLLGEYLTGLPYKSDVMNLNRDVWSSWSITQQEELLDTLRRKLRLYQLYNADADRWVALAPGSGAGDAVYPVPLSALP